MSSRPSRGAARLAAILDALPDALVLVNANGTVVNANTIALEAFEAPGTALVGRGLLDLLPEFDSRLIPGSMRRPESTDPRGRTKPKRMTARRTDGGVFPVEVTSANLENGQQAYDGHGYTGDELLMLVVRDLSGTVDTEAELARSQRQTEMILRAASEGVVGTDLDGRIVLVNPAAAQILGYRANELGGKELHTLVLHSRDDGEPFPYEGSPLADTLKSGRKHRVRGQVLWSKKDEKVPVDLTTAPVRDGDQLVGAVMTFTDRRPYDALAAEKEELEREHAAELIRLRADHAAELAEHAERRTEEIAAEKERYAALAEREKDRFEAQGARYEQVLAVLDGSLRGPLDELRHELTGLAADDAGQLWPEANQILHHLAAGYSRITTLVDNVLGYQRLDSGTEKLTRRPAPLDAVVEAGVEGAVELIGPGRAQFAVHAPKIEAEVDAAQLATALAHLIADVAGVDSTGNAPVAAEGYMDSTVVVAAAQRGEVVRIEVRGPYEGGDPVHQPIVRGIVRAHGGVLQTHEVPGISGSAYVLEVPIGEGAGTVPVRRPAEDDGASPEESGTLGGPRGGRRRARRGSTDAFLEGAHPTSSTDGAGVPEPTGGPDGTDGEVEAPTGRRRGRRAEETPTPDVPGPRAAEAEPAGRPHALPPAGGRPGPAGLGQVPPAGAGALAPRSAAAEPGTGMPALPPAGPRPVDPSGLPPRPAVPGALPQAAPDPAPPAAGRRARRALAPASERAPAAEAAETRTAFALPPADADRPDGAPRRPVAESETPAGHGALAAQAGAPRQPGSAPHDPVDDHTPPRPHPTEQPTGRRRAVGTVGAAGPVPTEPPGAPVPPPGVPPRPVTPPSAAPGVPVPPQGPPAHGLPAQEASADGRAGLGQPVPAAGLPGQMPPGAAVPAQAPAAPQRQPLPPAQPARTAPTDRPAPTDHAPTPAGTGSAWGVPPAQPTDTAPEGAEQDPHGVPARAFSVRTLGQGVPVARSGADPVPVPPAAPGSPGGSGRRRKLGTRPDAFPEQSGQVEAARPQAGGGQARLANSTTGPGRSYAIGAPAQDADEGPEPLDGPGGAVEVADPPQTRPMDDELPPEPLDNPRRLLVWPAPDMSTQQALSDRGYRPVIVHSREEVDAQIAAFPAALFVDPLTGPITRTALQSLRQAAVAAEVPVLVTAGLGQATREAAYGADPAVLLKALAPRDSEQHPSRVLLVEEHQEIALALTATLERRGMQVARAASDTEAVSLAAQMRPNLVVMDLMQVRRRRAGIVDWLRANGQLNRTPLVVYTAAVDHTELPRLSTGETVLFLAERSTSAEVQGRIVDLLARIGTN
ncbi:PAS domain-containing protein [Streptomyces sp. LE64]|uniref:PAS domain-containing protein n=1 Tax=Streptomyces sp. LE64 TaxID=3448653 RepID=UPI0040437293